MKSTVKRAGKGFGGQLITLLLGALLALPGVANAGAARTLAATAGLFDLYRLNRSEHIPNHITADFLLVAYSLIRAKNADQYESEIVIPKFSHWLQQLDKALPNDSNPASIANKKLTAVLLALLQGKPAPADKQAAGEFALIVKAEGVSRSPLLHRRMDYSLFRPSGRHAASEQGRRFFRAFRYASSILFPLLASKATGVTAENADLLFSQARQIAALYQRQPALAQSHKELTGLLQARFGKTDDLDWQWLENPSSTADSEIPSQRQAAFKKAKELHAQPGVIAEVVDKSQLESARSVADVVTGCRLLPAFATPVSSAFQQLIFDHTGRYQGETGKQPFSLGFVNGQPVKTFPRASEILALLGDKQSLDTLKSTGDIAFAGYDQAFVKARNLLANASGLSQQTLAIMRSLSALKGRNQSALGFWVWQRYLDQLYVKQTATPTGKGLNLNPARRGATLESAPEIYRMLAAMIATEQSLYPAKSWQAFASLIERIQSLQWKQSVGSPFSEADERFLNDLDTQLLRLTGGPDKPVAVAVHSNPASNERLWEATGAARVIRNNKARGALLSHHEFKLPISQSFDNAAWRQQLTRQKQTPH